MIWVHVDGIPNALRSNATADANQLWSSLCEGDASWLLVEDLVNGSSTATSVMVPVHRIIAIWSDGGGNGE